MLRVKDKGDLYVHQDANWNVIGLTDLGGNLVERYLYKPYGEMLVHQTTGYGDYDGDIDVDSTDRAAAEVGGACRGSSPSGACRILDLDFDGDVDDDDLTEFDSLPQGLAYHPGRRFTAVDQPFGHQGLLFDAEVGSYQNRARQYDPVKRRFVQRDPLGGGADAGDEYQDGLNLYGYTKDNPIALRDPSGLGATDPCLDMCSLEHNSTHTLCDIMVACWRVIKLIECKNCVNSATTECISCCGDGTVAACRKVFNDTWDGGDCW